MNLVKKILLIFLLLFPSIFIQAQPHLVLRSSKGQDTINVCFSEQVYFYAYLINGNDTLFCQWDWDMDDGTTFSGMGLDTVKYNFVLEKAHRVIATATYNGHKYSKIIVVRTGLSPYFSGTRANLAPNQTGVCKGDQVQLIGKVSDKKSWRDHPVSVYYEPFPFKISDQVSYSNSITRKDFNPDSLFSSKYVIDSVGLLIVHSNSADLKISLTSPSGDTVILKNSGGNDNYFGDTARGTSGAKWYYWSPGASRTINSLAITRQMIPPAAYLPYQSFDSLLSSPLNGKWTIRVEDLFPGNDGYILAWALFFSPRYVSDTLKYTCTYDLDQSFWQGDNVNLTSDGLSEAFPGDYGPHPYKFYVKDNFGCFHDTTIGVIVEKPDFDLDKPVVYIGDSIKVEDKTSWATSSSWDFADNSPMETGKSVYHKYQNKGNYVITLTAQSSSGCTDQDTAVVQVIPKPIKITKYNVFTPNGDGVNDVFSFFNTPDEKIIAANIEKIDARIYDRDGNLVCRWTTPEQAIKGWDGTINNRGRIPASEGFYYYIIIIKGKDGKNYKPISGFIYLHR